MGVNGDIIECTGCPLLQDGVCRLGFSIIEVPLKRIGLLAGFYLGSCECGLKTIKYIKEGNLVFLSPIRGEK
jgi:hypothetical protein